MTNLFIQPIKQNEHKPNQKKNAYDIHILLPNYLRKYTFRSKIIYITCAR